MLFNQEGVIWNNVWALKSMPKYSTFIADKEANANQTNTKMCIWVTFQGRPKFSYSKWVTDMWLKQYYKSLAIAQGMRHKANKEELSSWSIPFNTILNLAFYLKSTLRLFF